MQAKRDKQQTAGHGSSPAPTALRKTFKARHLTMIALGGSIGTGLFLPAAVPSPHPARAEHFWPIQRLVLWFIS